MVVAFEISQKKKLVHRNLVVRQSNIIRDSSLILVHSPPLFYHKEKREKRKNV